MNFVSWAKIFCTLNTNELFDTECFRSPFTLFLWHAVRRRRFDLVFAMRSEINTGFVRAKILVCRQRVHDALRAAPASETGRYFAVTRT